VLPEQIRDAQEKGQFDNLLGKGKPLDLTPNPYAGDREMAYKILSDAGYAPEWIELDKAIRGRLERARTALVRAWQWHRESAGEPGGAAALTAWQAAVGVFHEEVAAINAQITELNLKVPSPCFQRAKVDAGREVRSLEEGAA